MCRGGKWPEVSATTGKNGRGEKEQGGESKKFGTGIVESTGN